MGVFSPSEIQCVQELWNEYLQQGERSGYTFLTFRDGDKTLGYACFGPHALAEGVWDLYWIAVDPGAHSRGVGRALMQRMEELVSAQQGRLILIETSGTPAYEPARRFYEACGYRYQAVIHDFYSPGDDLIIFGKTLHPVPAAACAA
ncbi:MAG: GNAT family N-acetyltransferase [Anaerolineae bacterium]